MLRNTGTHSISHKWNIAGIYKELNVAFLYCQLTNIQDLKSSKMHKLLTWLYRSDRGAQSESYELTERILSIRKEENLTD